MRGHTTDQVVLYSPNYVAKGRLATGAFSAVPPLSQLAVAGPVRDAGYEVCMLDGRWDLDWKKQIRDRADQIACVGITSLTGPSVADGLEFATYVRSLRPDVPIVWGGWHASFAARQAVEDSRVDVVVRGMGESTIVELLAAFRSGSPLSEIRGITFRNGHEIVETPDRPLEDINRFPPPAYDLIDPRRYIDTSRPGIREAGTIFSRGCPYACDFCLDSKNKWIGLTVYRMMTDIEFWIAQGANHICFYDGNFFLGRKRMVEFCNAILARGLEKQFRWSATAVGNRVVQMDDELLALLARAGLVCVAIGAESGSDELLKRITNKTTVTNTLESIRRLARHNIDPYLFFVVGYPDEPADALARTFDLALEAKKINPNSRIQMNFTTPLPGSEVFRVAVARGLVKEPRSYAEWAEFNYNHPNLIPITPEYARRVHRFVRYLEAAYPGTRVAAAGPREWIRKPIRRLARWRLQNRYFDLPVELNAIDALRKLRGIPVT